MKGFLDEERSWHAIQASFHNQTMTDSEFYQVMVWLASDLAFDAGSTDYTRISSATIAGRADYQEMLRNRRSRGL